MERGPWLTLNFLSRLTASSGAKGFSMLETLVTVLIISVGLLGVAGMQLRGLKNNESAHLRSQATIYAYEILDRLRANRQAAIAGSYNSELSATSAQTAPGNGASITAVDRYDWYRKLDSALPGAKGAINCDANGICTITVQWDDARATGSTSLQQQTLAARI